MIQLYSEQFDLVRSCNHSDDEGRNCDFWDDMAKLAYPNKYLRKYWTILHPVFRVGRNNYMAMMITVTFVCGRSGDIAVVTN